VFRDKVHSGIRIAETLHDSCRRKSIPASGAEEEMSTGPRTESKEMERRKTASTGNEHRGRAFVWQRKAVTDRPEQVERMAFLRLGQQRGPSADNTVNELD